MYFDLLPIHIQLILCIFKSCLSMFSSGHHYHSTIQPRYRNSSDCLVSVENDSHDHDDNRDASSLLASVLTLQRVVRGYLTRKRLSETKQLYLSIIKDIEPQSYNELHKLINSGTDTNIETHPDNAGGLLHKCTILCTYSCRLRKCHHSTVKGLKAWPYAGISKCDSTIDSRRSSLTVEHLSSAESGQDVTERESSMANVKCTSPTKAHESRIVLVENAVQTDAEYLNPGDPVTLVTEDGAENLVSINKILPSSPTAYTTDSLPTVVSSSSVSTTNTQTVAHTISIGSNKYEDAVPTLSNSESAVEQTPNSVNLSSAIPNSLSNENVATGDTAAVDTTSPKHPTESTAAVSDDTSEVIGAVIDPRDGIAEPLEASKFIRKEPSSDSVDLQNPTGQTPLSLEFDDRDTNSYNHHDRHANSFLSTHEVEPCDVGKASTPLNQTLQSVASLKEIDINSTYIQKTKENIREMSRLEQTSVWYKDSSSNTEPDTKYEVICGSREELTSLKEDICMELVWIEQAIASRKQFLSFVSETKNKSVAAQTE